MGETDKIKELITNPAANTEQGGGKKISDFTGKPSQSGTLYGDALNDTNINDIIEDTPPHVVVLIGFPKYGKSTFVASFYHAVMTTGAIGKYKFIDSDTLLGFERRAHIRREELKVGMRLDRTPIYADFFLSLLFENTHTGQKVKLILSDRSGEAYLEYGKQAAKLDEDLSLRHAGHLLFFLDASAVAGGDFLEMQSNLNMLLPRMNKYGAFNERKRVDVVFNKKDLVKDEQKTDYETNKTEILKMVGKVAAVNKDQELESLHIPTNDECNKFFEYLLDCCEQPTAITADVKEKLDWAGKKTKMI